MTRVLSSSSSEQLCNVPTAKQMRQLNNNNDNFDFILYLIKDKILAVFEKVFNEKMGLSTIPHVAELERFLIREGKYE